MAVSLGTRGIPDRVRKMAGVALGEEEWEKGANVYRVTSF
jgi:hypothetical protein